VSADLEAVRRRADACVEADDSLRSSLVALRKSRGLTIAEVSDRTGLSEKTIRAFERYDADPRLSTLRRYAVAVDASYRHEIIEEAAR